MARSNLELLGQRGGVSRGMLFTVVVVTIGAVVLASNFMTPEKRVDRQIEHLHSSEDPQFEREMGVLLGPAIASGNRIEALNNGDEIFPSMLEAISRAQHNVNFETFIYWSGTIGRKMADALAERARAGVTVNVLLDWVGSIKMADELLELMSDAGVVIHRYRPLHWYHLGRMNNRTHRKLLVVDGTVAFTGGVGIADQWRGNAESPEHWRDMHFRVEGPVVAQFQAAFNDNWIKTTGRVLHGPQYFPPPRPVADMDAHLFISSPAGGSESMHLMYLMAIAAATQRIDLAAAYFVPDELMIDALIQARERGVKIRVMVPGEHIDTDSVRLASRASWGPMLQAGVEIYEYLPTMTHTKMLIIDEQMVSVGSTNFDVRSFSLNDEASMNVYDERFARRMRETFERDLEQSHLYIYETWAARPWHERFMEAVVLPLRSQL